jgi:hypothetical protein
MIKMKIQSLGREFLVKEYAFYKQKAFDSYERKKINECLKYIEYCGLIAWFYPILEKFCDDELESLMCRISSEHISIQSKTENNANRIIFYNSQIVDSGGLTEQYLNFFLKTNYEVLVIIPDIKFSKLGAGILKIVESNSNITLFVAKGEDPLAKIQSITTKIISFQPKSAFLHLTPADIVGFASFCKFKTITRYYIVHNDHTFWFGKACSDYFIEFRKFGYVLASQRRGIKCSRLYILPYYPIKQDVQFQGFPFNPEGKIIGFSGANLYKYYLDPELTYFYAIKELILRNPEFVFCLAGYGNTLPVEQFIKTNGLQNSFFFLGKRKDFFALINNIDILFDSYPLKGGLTVLYGIENHKAITGIGDNRNASGCLEDFFDLTDYKQPQNIKDFISEADILIKNKDERESNAFKFAQSKFNIVDFESGLNTILEGFVPNENPVYNENLKLDDNYYLAEYLKLPDSAFDFYFRKLFTLKDVLAINERVLLVLKLSRLKPKAIKKRIIRYTFLVLFGK